MERKDHSEMLLNIFSLSFSNYIAQSTEMETVRLVHVQFTSTKYMIDLHNISHRESDLNF